MNPGARIRLHVDVIDNSIGLTGEYVQESGASADLDVRQLHRTLHLSGNASWTRGDFILKPDGQFQMKLIDEGAARLE